MQLLLFYSPFSITLEKSPYKFATQNTNPPYYSRHKALSHPFWTVQHCWEREREREREREAFNQLLQFLESNELLDPRQACYRRGHSTKTALTDVIKDIRQAIEESKFTILILFDFSKAFNSIPHRWLLQKLRTFYLSNPTITWIYNYICERYQAVINEDGTITSWAKS